MRADAGACGPKMRGHRLRNCTKDLILLAHSGEAQARKRRGLRRCLDGFSARSLTGRQGEGRTETRDGKRGTAPKGRALFVGPVFLNKIRVLCLFAGGRSHRRGGFFARWGRRAPPVPAAAGVNLLRFPRPRRGRGTGGGRGEGCGRKRRGKKDQAADRHGAEQARAPTRRRRGRRSTAPEERPKGRRGGNGGPRPPVWALARQGGCRGCSERPGAARERPRRGRGQAAADPRQRRGLPMRPTLFAPAQTPGGGEHGAGGARSGGQGGGSRRKAGPQLRPPDAPLQEAPSPRDAVRRKRRAPRLSKPGRSPR